MIPKPQSDQDGLADYDTRKGPASSAGVLGLDFYSHPVICSQDGHKQAKVDHERTDFRRDNVNC